MFSLVNSKTENRLGKGILCEILQLQVAGFNESMRLAPPVSHFINA